MKFLPAKSHRISGMNIYLFSNEQGSLRGRWKSNLLCYAQWKCFFLLQGTVWNSKCLEKFIINPSPTCSAKFLNSGHLLSFLLEDCKASSQSNKKTKYSTKVVYKIISHFVKKIIGWTSVTYTKKVLKGQWGNYSLREHTCKLYKSYYSNQKWLWSFIKMALHED